MEKVGLNITPKKFKQLSKWSENIYNTAVVIDYFVANQPEIEECYNLTPIVFRTLLKSIFEIFNRPVWLCV